MSPALRRHRALLQGKDDVVGLVEESAASKRHRGRQPPSPTSSAPATRITTGPDIASC